MTVLLIGSSGHSKVVIDIFCKMGVDILGLIDSFRQAGEQTLGFPVLGGEADIPGILTENPDLQLFVAIGDNWARQQVSSRIVANNPNVRFASAIHPGAEIGLDVEIGQGVAIMAGVTINSSTKIEDFCIINTRASVDHDNQIGKFSSLAPGVCTGGHVKIGSNTAVGIGAIVKNQINIGSDSVIGAGSVVVKDIEDQMVAYGVPARHIRRREPDEKYL